MKKVIIPFLFTLFTFTSFIKPNDAILEYEYNSLDGNIAFYWKNNDTIIGSLEKLNKYISKKGKQLIFAMNGGMYMEDQKPLGLYIENGKVITKLNTRSASGNFYMKPNGVFYITDKNKAVVCKTEEFINNGHIKYATQSGPMLIINDTIHKDFTKGSKNINIRNGVGVLPDGKIIFAITKQPMNFYDFAMYFKNKGCKNALYLDGFVSRAYYPEKKWEQKDGKFGVIIGIIK